MLVLLIQGGRRGSKAGVVGRSGQGRTVVRMGLCELGQVLEEDEDVPEA